MQITPIKLNNSTQIKNNNKKDNFQNFGSIQPQLEKELIKKHDIFLQRIILPVFNKTQKFQLKEIYKSHLQKIYLVDFSDYEGKAYQIEYPLPYKKKYNIVEMEKIGMDFIRKMKNNILSTNMIYRRQEEDKIRNHLHGYKDKSITDIKAQYKETRKLVIEEIKNLSTLFSEKFS